MLAQKAAWEAFFGARPRKTIEIGFPIFSWVSVHPKTVLLVIRRPFLLGSQEERNPGLVLDNLFVLNHFPALLPSLVPGCLRYFLDFGIGSFMLTWKAVFLEGHKVQCSA